MYLFGPNEPILLASDDTMEASVEILLICWSMVPFCFVEAALLRLYFSALTL